MTRETKVGLLVGLGIILLIGIIVSDHLSIVNDQTAADLTDFAAQSQHSINPSVVRPARAQRQPMNPAVSSVGSSVQGDERRLAPSKPLPLPSSAPARPPVSTPRRWESPLPTARLAGDSAKAVPTLSQTGAGLTSEIANSPQPPTPASTPRPRQPVIHYVKSGESLWQIAQRYYDDGDRWQWIAQANRGAVAADGAVRVGVRLMIPDPSHAMVAGTGGRSSAGADTARVAAAKAPKRPTSRKAVRDYTVAENDSLYKIAVRTLGDGDRWNDIYQANRDRLDNPIAFEWVSG